MANGYKKCTNGHFYKDNLTQCPYCKGNGTSVNQGNETAEYIGGAGAAVGGGATVVNNGGGAAVGGGSGATMVNGGGGMSDGTKTQIMPGGAGFNGNETVQNSYASGIQEEPVNSPKPSASASKTMIFDEEPDGNEGSGDVRSSRKLVGWLVSYSLSEMGVDFKLFEGRNVIGRDLDCQISVDDNTVSSKHAVLLFRGGSYFIQDSLSTSGTRVNGKDTGVNAVSLNDGDIIQVGKTVFKFRTSF